MPQLDPSSFSSQLFWLTVSFVVLYILLARFLLPRVHSVLVLRTGTVEGDLTQASRMKAEAEAAKAAYEKGLQDARAKSQAMLGEAQATIAAGASAQQAKLHESVEKKLAESDATIKKAKQDVLNKLSPVSGELASLIVEALVHYKPTAQEIGAVMTELAKERAI